MLEGARSTLQELRAAVSREVKDPARAAQGVKLVDELTGILAEAGTDIRAHDARLRTLNANYDATQAQFQAAFRDFNARRDARQRRVLDLNQRGKALLTAEEWDALGKVREEALERLLQLGEGA